jgi:hypothetical protein
MARPLHINISGGREGQRKVGKMKKLLFGLMLVAILGVGAASASAQGYNRGNNRGRTVVVTTSFDGHHDGSGRDGRGDDWRQMERARLERERLAHEQNHRFGQDFNRDRGGNQRFRRF